MGVEAIKIFGFFFSLPLPYSEQKILCEVHIPHLNWKWGSCTQWLSTGVSCLPLKIIFINPEESLLYSEELSSDSKLLWRDSQSTMNFSTFASYLLGSNKKKLNVKCNFRLYNESKYLIHFIINLPYLIHISSLKVSLAISAL